MKESMDKIGKKELELEEEDISILELTDIVELGPGFRDKKEGVMVATQEGPAQFLEKGPIFPSEPPLSTRQDEGEKTSDKAPPFIELEEAPRLEEEEEILIPEVEIELHEEEGPVEPEGEVKKQEIGERGLLFEQDLRFEPEVRTALEETKELFGPEPQAFSPLDTERLENMIVDVVERTVERVTREVVTQVAERLIGETIAALKETLAEKR